MNIEEDNITSYYIKLVMNYAINQLGLEVGHTP